MYFICGDNHGKWALPSVWLVLILVGSSLPGDQVPLPAIWGLDKVLHFAEYLVLALLTMRAATTSWPPNGPGAVGLVGITLTLLALAAVDEWHQTLIPSRHASCLDLLADWSGLVAGVALGKSLTRHSRNHKSSDCA